MYIKLLDFLFAIKVRNNAYREMNRNSYVFCISIFLRFSFNDEHGMKLMESESKSI